MIKLYIDCQELLNGQRILILLNFLTLITPKLFENYRMIRAIFEGKKKYFSVEQSFLQKSIVANPDTSLRKDFVRVSDNSRFRREGDITNLMLEEKRIERTFLSNMGVSQTIIIPSPIFQFLHQYTSKRRGTEQGKLLKNYTEIF